MAFVVSRAVIGHVVRVVLWTVFQWPITELLNISPLDGVEWLGHFG